MTAAERASDVVVVGAGVAGLTCAQDLPAAGVGVKARAAREVLRDLGP
ncbi:MULTISPECIES: hypothetical protein [unclassified Streptomyces]